LSNRWIEQVVRIKRSAASPSKRASGSPLLAVVQHDATDLDLQVDAIDERSAQSPEIRAHVAVAAP
jgi:hypothetical protein